MTDKLLSAVEVELLPCPFCGKELIVIEDDSYGACYVGCNCEPEPGVQAATGNLKDAAVMWNQRTLPDATPGEEVGRLRAALREFALEFEGNEREARANQQYYSAERWAGLAALALAALHPQEKR